LSGLLAVKAVRKAERKYRPAKSRMNGIEKSICIAVIREKVDPERFPRRGGKASHKVIL
jgi:hypothetical protein